MHKEDIVSSFFLPFESEQSVEEREIRSDGVRPETVFSPLLPPFPCNLVSRRVSTASHLQLFESNHRQSHIAPLRHLRLRRKSPSLRRQVRIPFQFCGVLTPDRYISPSDRGLLFVGST
ncbi:hypothetical protein PIB30_075835 [Stylosanthes scabra]|uniref:Uncharacterized protein n=1 Tax=Stylosanthes scabra TaxID=79078 RepID=A0ABU6XN11_9FABA|nr:hypothetical protein [Stylosanthes scabra]